MKKRPFVHAILAELYITVLVLGVHSAFVSRGVRDTVLIPIAMLSLFVLSAAVMGYLFLAVPLQLYIDGKKKEAVVFFGQTVGVFAVITAVISLFLSWWFV